MVRRPAAGKLARSGDWQRCWKTLEAIRRAVNTLTDVMIASAPNSTGRRVAATRSRIAAIRRIVAARFEIPQPLLFSRCREEKLVWPRHVTWYLCSQLTDITSLGLGKIFQRDHATMLSAVRHVRDLMSIDRSKLAQVNALADQVVKQIGGKV